jgi:UDP-galactopyranose mutase
VDNVIIGAGLAGLSAAYHLKDDYIIFEREDHVGGLCWSVDVDGFVFDKSIHILYSADAYATSLIKDVLLKGNFHSQARESFIYLQGVYTEYPFQAHTFGLPPHVIEECLLGLVKARYENHTGARPKNFAEWVIATFGEGIAKYFMLPYNRRQWGIPPELMDYTWIDGRVPTPKVEEVLHGALFPPKKKFGPNSEFWYPETGGIKSLPLGFVPHIKNLQLNTGVVKINTKRNTVKLSDNEECVYKNVISTLPLPVVIRLLDEVPRAVQDAANDLQYNTIHTINLCIDRPAISDKHWVYFPEDEFVFHRLSFMMNFSEKNAPAGKSSITVEISESKYKRINHNALFEDTLRGLQRIGIIRSKDEVINHCTMSLTPAYVIYDLSHRKNVNLIKEYLESRNIHSCGRFGDWEYLNMDHAILSGKRVADKISEPSPHFSTIAP